MSGTTWTVHVRSSVERLVAVVEATMKRLGWERLSAPARVEPEVRRIVIHPQGSWVSLAETEVDTPDDWAKAASKQLGAPVLTVWTWEDEDVVTLRVYVGGRRRASIETPRALRRRRGASPRLPVAPLAPWIADARRDAIEHGLDLGERTPNELTAYEAELRALGLSAGAPFVDGPVDGERVLDAVAELIDLPRPVIDPYSPDPADGDLELEFRPVARREQRTRAPGAATAPASDDPSRPIVPPRIRAHDPSEAAAAYAGQRFLCGWLAFEGPTTSFRTVLSRDLGSLLARLAAIGPPPTGMTLADEAGRTRQEPYDLDDLLRAVLRAGTADVHAGRSSGFWLAHTPRAQGRVLPAPLVMGWSVARPTDPDSRESLVAISDEAVRCAVTHRGCVGAIVAAQGLPIHRGNVTLPYELLAGTSAGGIRLPWFRRHPRSPGWRALVPRAAEGPLGPASDLVEVSETPSGRLVRSSAGDPFGMSDRHRRALERLLLPVLGSEAEVDRLVDDP